MKSLLVCGTSSDAGKSVLVAGLCRCLRDRGFSVAPFKAQNMSLNSFVTKEGAEIGRAQAAQAWAAGIEPEAAMNPVLIKPTTDTAAQVIVMGRPLADADARAYDDFKPSLLPTIVDAFERLKDRFDVVVCEGAGSLAEFNLRERDVVNLGFARDTGTPVVVVADIDRGGAFAGLYGSLALLTPEDQALVSGFILNKFRGDARLLEPAITSFRALTGRPFFGIVPWVRDLVIDAEDSLAIAALTAIGEDAHADPLHVAVIRLRSMSNFTDFEPLALEPGVLLRFTDSPAEISAAHLVIVPGTKATVADLSLLHERGLDRALAARVEAGKPILGICGGYQMLGKRIVDVVESGAGEVAGLGLLPIETVFELDKVLSQRAGRCPALASDVHGYEIRHGRSRRFGGEPVFEGVAGDEGCRQGSVWGTSWHGILESDTFRGALLAWVAEQCGVEWKAGLVSFAAARESQIQRLGELVETHLDVTSLLELIEHGQARSLPVLAPGGVP